MLTCWIVVYALSCQLPTCIGLRIAYVWRLVVGKGEASLPAVGLGVYTNGAERTGPEPDSGAQRGCVRVCSVALPTETAAVLSNSDELKSRDITHAQDISFPRRAGDPVVACTMYVCRAARAACRVPVTRHAHATGTVLTWHISLHSSSRVGITPIGVLVG